MARVHTLARRTDAPAMLVQLTDCHLFGEPDTVMLGVNTDASLRAVLRQIEADGKHPDLLLATDDLSQDGEPAAYQRLAAILGAAPALEGARIRCLPGNHDLPVAMRHELPEWSVPVTDVGAWRVVSLDTTVPGSNAGHLPDSQLDLLEAALADARTQTVSTLIDIKVLPKTMVHGYLSWWRVGVAQVSTSERTNAAAKKLNEHLAQARQY